MHGQFINWDGQYNFRAADRSFRRERFSFREDPRPVAEPMFAIDTYRIDLYNEQRGEGYRQMRVGILEGRELFHEEQRQLDWDMHDVPWRPKRNPSILNDFDRWFAWCAYKHTGDFSYIREYV